MNTRFSSDHFFWQMVWLTLGIKLLLGWLLPFTGDEAYFVVWGNNLDYGYYDHPGMTGWWIWLTLLIDQSPLVVRLPAIVGPILMAVLMRGFLRRVDQKTGNLAAVLFLLSPLNLVNVLMTTDTPIFILSLVSGWLIWRAETGRVEVELPAGRAFSRARPFSPSTSPCSWGFPTRSISSSVVGRRSSNWVWSFWASSPGRRSTSPGSTTIAGRISSSISTTGTRMPASPSKGWVCWPHPSFCFWDRPSSSYLLRRRDKVGSETVARGLGPTPEDEARSFRPSVLFCPSWSSCWFR